MPKRCNPYIDDFVQQSKMHIGLKQFNNNEDKLKKVYGKYIYIFSVIQFLTNSMAPKNLTILLSLF